MQFDVGSVYDIMTDSAGDGETNLNSTQLFSCKVNQPSLYTS